VKKLSVVTSLIGYHPLLLDTLKSVLNQRGVAAEDLEYVVWYGGSPNPLINDVIETFSDRVRFLGDNDDGLYDSLAQVLPLLSGEVICYLNVVSHYCCRRNQLLFYKKRLSMDLWNSEFLR
jgi:hypothetical protein